MFTVQCFLMVSVLGASADRIDAIVDANALAAHHEQLSKCDDDTFLRRVSLDMIGRIPTRDELLSFRVDPNRVGLVTRLLESSEFPVFWSRLWTAQLVGYGNQFNADREALRLWLESQFRQRMPLDDIVRELIAAEGQTAFNGQVNFLVRHRDDPVVPIGRVFLGIQLDCARCHDHPTDRWKQKDHENFRRFFSLMRPRQISNGNYQLVDARPSDGNLPQFLTGSKPSTGRWRSELGLYVVHSKPFARTMANRLWHHFFGVGIVDPPDDFGPDHPASDMELLELLADDLTANNFDFYSLIPAIVLSDAYQRNVAEGAQHFALAPRLKPLTPDQLFDSLKQILRFDEDARMRDRFVREAIGLGGADHESNPWIRKENIQGLLSRMSIQDRASETSMEQIFQQTLSRDATQEELEICRERTDDEVLFALVHGNEFCFWH